MNISRNKFSSFHQEALNPEEKFFPELIELNIAFNVIEDQHGLEYCLYIAQTQRLKSLDITGNPLACDPMNFAELDGALSTYGCRLISEQKMPAAPLHRIKRLGLGGVAVKPQEKDLDSRLFGELQAEPEPRFEETERVDDTPAPEEKDENFFVTGEEVPGQPVFEDTLKDVENAEEVDENYGKRKMNLFRDKCRAILIDGAPFENDDVAYEGEAMDIVSAYKKLNLDMSKNVRGLSKPVIGNKGYLKPTMASKQATRAVFVPGALDKGPISRSAHELPPVRGYTAPT